MNKKVGENKPKTSLIISLVVLVIIIALVISVFIINYEDNEYNNENLYNYNSYKTYEEFNKEFSEYNTDFDISKKAGHSSVNVTHNTYSHFFDSEFKKCASVMDNILKEAK